MKKVLNASALLLAMATPVAAQSSLGITGSEFYLGAIQDEAGQAQGFAQVTLDVAVTEFHGLQGDLTFADTDGGLIGRLGAHLYMTPKPGQKYGVFVNLSDVDGRAMSWGSFGIEGMLEAGDDGLLEGRVGLGLSDVDSLDYIFAGVAYTTDLTEEIELQASVDIAEFDEPALSAIAYDIGLTAKYSKTGSPWSIYGTLSYAGLTGTNDHAGEPRIGFGVSMSFGSTGGTDAHTRAFRQHDTVAPLIRRDLW